MSPMYDNCNVLFPNINNENNIIVMGLMKMENIVSRAGTEPTSLAFQTSVLTIDVNTIPMHTYLCSSLSQRSVQTTTLIPSEL